MSELPSYHHLSPEQIEELSFRVTLRPVRGAFGEASGGELLFKDIVWKETYPKVFGPPNEENQRICIFTYTSADVVPYDGKLPNCKKGDLHEANLEGQGFSLRNKPRVKHTNRDKMKDRLHREDSCKVMVIMAAVNCSTETQEIVLCVIKLYPTGLVSSYPGISDVETEDLDDTSVFMSRRSVDAVIGNGPRLRTYSFTLAKSIYEYTIEWYGARALLHDEPEVTIAELHNIEKEAVDERRDLIRKEFDSFDCMYENEGPWRNQVHIEIASVDGFAESNMLLCMPLGSNFVVHYRVLKYGGQIKKGDVILEGATSNAQSYSVCECLEFAAHFVVAFIGASFAILLSLGDTGDEFLQSILLLIVPLLLITSAKVFSDTTVYHFNHNFSLLYNIECSDMIQDDCPLLLELHAYFKHNFGLTSLAGYGTTTLPTETGNYNIGVPTWKPIACSGMGETRCRMHDFFLGSCLNEIGPLVPVPTSEIEGEMVEDVDVRLFSKGGLVSDGSGTVNVRIHVSRIIRRHGDPKSHAEIKSTEPQQYRVRMRTVDEVLSRVRQNKRGRMSRSTIYPGK